MVAEGAGAIIVWCKQRCTAVASLVNATRATDARRVKVTRVRREQDEIADVCPLHIALLLPLCIPPLLCAISVCM